MAVAVSVALCAVGCDVVATPPERPAVVPPRAIWGGGVDGGSWLACEVISANGCRLSCHVWSDEGELWSRGEYVYGRSRGRPEVDCPDRRSTWRLFSGYDGDTIYVEDGLLLLPDGVVDFPFGDGGGKKQKYSAGIAVGDEAEYPGPAG
jgi:hypothetical protein